MATSCDNPAKVTLNYQSVIPHKIYYSGKKYHHSGTTLGRNPAPPIYQDGETDYFFISAPNSETEITWDFTENSDNTYYRYTVTVTLANPTIDSSNNEFFAYFPGQYSPIGFWFEESGLARWEIENLTPQKTSNAVHPGWYKVDNSSDTASHNSILDISLEGQEIYEILGYAWDINIYFDGELQLTRGVRTSTESPPEDRVFITEATPGSPKTETFNFVNKPQEVKLIQVEGTEYTWKLIKVVSEEQEEEISLFYGIEPELSCFLQEGACPQDTCPVSCGDTICCYNSEGIPVDSFLKSESIY